MNDRPKILFLITKASWGGAQRYVYDLAGSMPQNDFDVGVAFGERGRLATMLETKGIPTHEIPSLSRDISLRDDIASYRAIRRALAAVQPDILHLNSSKAAGLGALAARLQRIPVIVYTVHGWPFKENRNLIVRAALYLISWLTALLSTHIIVVSKEDERLGKNMPGIEKKITCIPLGHPGLNLAPPDEAFRNMFGTLSIPPITGKTVRIVSIAELTRNKGIAYGIEAIATLRERGVDSIYVVPGGGEQLQELLSLAKRLGVEDRVFFPGFIPDASRYLSGFDVYLLPSIKEGTPYVLIEAALAGLPVVATSVVDKELVDSLGTIRIVPPKNSFALADAIEELSGKPRMEPPDVNPFPLSDMVRKTLEIYTGPATPLQ
jgi:glycosyltransferase involved in cell wall biosynthesis